jgi:hypothetical protein
MSSLSSGARIVDLLYSSVAHAASVRARRPSPHGRFMALGLPGRADHRSKRR